MRKMFTIAIFGLALSAAAFGQSNSLFGKARGAAKPAPKPAGTSRLASDDGSPGAAPPAGGVVPGGAGPAIRASYRPPKPTAQVPPTNPALMAISTIAVEAPQPQKIDVGSFVTIIIRESKTSRTDSKTESKKDWKMDWELAKWFRLDPQDRLVPQNFERAGKPGADFDFQNDWSGEGKVDRRDELTTRITATVIDVKPNGNLVLEAKKKIGSDEEQQVVTLTGSCRAQDVTAENTVLSTQIADLNIEAKHTGAARDAARRGWLMKAFDWLRPV